MPHPRPGRVATGALLAAAAVAAVPATASAASKHDVTVMSRNIYLGADLIPIAAAPTLPAAEQAVADVWANVQKTDFPTRAKALAKEVRTTKPDLIGLQEAALWRTGAKDGDATRANTVVYDFTRTLLAEFAKAGQRYRVVVSQDQFDLEGPSATGQDVRLTMRDVILVRTGKGAKVRTGKTSKGHYRKLFVAPTQFGEATALRGWVATDAKVGKHRFRFVNTHLEAYGGDIRAAQAKELLGSRGPLASKKRPAILVGDLNSDPRDKTVDGQAYRLIAKAGFKNAFSKPVATSGQDELLDNATSKARRHIDHVLMRPKMRASRTRVVGGRPSDRINGLWPSDHNGVVATIRLK